MKRNRTAAVMLAAVIAVFSGCSSSEKAPSGTESSASTADTSASAVTEQITENTASEEEKKEAELSFSADSGFYDKKFSLEINCVRSDAVIRYTTDGTVPDENSQAYSGPIELSNKSPEPNVLSAHTGISIDGNYVPDKKIDKANVIRAVAFYPDGTRSEVINGTFWVGVNRVKKYADLPVISLFTDPDNLFDYEKGIYVLGKRYDEYLEEMNGEHFETWEAEANFTGRGKEWERPVAVQYILPDNTMAFEQDMGMRIMGAASRNSAQKSIRLVAREEYGKKNVKYEVIPDNLRSDGTGNVEKYKSFVLRNGGNDCDNAKVRDPLLQELVSDRRFDTLQYTPCVVYLDGEYWGMYTITEDYSENYIENNYGIDSKNVVMIKRGELEEGEEQDIELFYELFDYITGNDMSIADNYAAASEMFDMGSFADYCAFNIYIYNEDSIFKDNNWRMWRVRQADDSSDKADGKWRMLVYDTDYSTGIYSGGQNASHDNFTEIFNPEPKEDVEEDYRDPGELFRSLYKNPDFKAEFVNALCDIRNYNFETDRATSRLDELATIYKQVVPATFDRFGPEWLFFMDRGQYYEFKIYELAGFLAERYEVFPELMEVLLELPERCSGKISVSDKSLGSIKINNTELQLTDSDSVSATYFPGYPVTVNAIPSEGHSFVRWECDGCTVSDPSSPEITADVTGEFSIRAIFE